MSESDCPADRLGLAVQDHAASVAAELEAKLQVARQMQAQVEHDTQCTRADLEAQQARMPRIHSDSFTANPNPFLHPPP